MNWKGRWDELREEVQRFESELGMVCRGIDDYLILAKQGKSAEEKLQEVRDNLCAIRRTMNSLPRYP
jgi:hypothetical protein